MHRFSTLILIMLCLGSVAGATTTTYVTTDGVWWADLTPAAKVVAIFAETDGFNAGIDHGYGNELIYAYTEYHKYAPSKTLPDFNKFIATYERDRPNVKILANPSFANHGMSVFTDKIDAFYAKYPNRKSVRVGALLPCIANNSRINCSTIIRI